MGCTDSSPQFSYTPLLAANVSELVIHNPGAYDPNGDAMRFEFSPVYYMDDFNGMEHPVDINPAISELPHYPFDSLYSFTSPFPSDAVSPGSQAAVLDSTSGTIHYLSTMVGHFDYAFRIISYRNGMPISEIFNENIVLIGTGGQVNQRPIISNATFSGNITNVTVQAGQPVNLSFVVSDNDTLPSGLPQHVTITGIGNQFSTTQTNPNDCNLPPCATLQVLPVGNNNQQLVTFDWQTDCVHIQQNDACQPSGNVYSFIIESSDDRCPLPSVNRIVVTVTILPPPLDEPISVQLQADENCWLSATQIPNATYYFYRNGNLVYNGPSSTFQVAVGGEYTVEAMVNADECKVGCATSAPVYCSGVGFEEVNTSPLMIYPNPAGEFIFYKNHVPGAQLSMYDACGKHLCTYQLDNEGALNPNLPPAMYHYVWTSQGKKINGRLVVCK